MIDQSIRMFLDYNFKEAIHQKLFPFMFEYVDYVLPILIEGNHTPENEMECCASQYHHLSYIPTDREDVHYIYYRNEQNTGLLLEVQKCDVVQEVSCYWVAQPLRKEINSTTLEELRRKIGDNYNRLVQSGATFKELMESPKLKRNQIFSISRLLNHPENRVRVDDRSVYHTLDDQLKVFDLMNAMVCGVSEELGEDLPKSFSNHFKAANELMDKLIKALE